jgi:2-polyprenyl-6-methoxyphenol hydroxylase-like FAD-dependent oxidoreductase
MSSVQVLIAGAGPTGLVLALWLRRLGVNIRIVDSNAGPGTTSRAIGVQARTLEFYRQLQIADEVVSQGLELTAANLWVRGKRVARAAFGEMGKGLSPYPYMLIFPQDEHEQLLIAELAADGVHVERDTELVHVEEKRGGVTAQFRGPDGMETICDAAYLAACDGARSPVRHALGIGFPGGTYSHRFYVADAQGSGPVMDGELHVALDRADFLAAFPMKGGGRARLIGMAEASEDGREALAWDDVGKGVLDRLDVEVGHVNWFSTYHVHHRVAERFRSGRVLLLGDAAHVHSPVGGQGMNTGIADATNLGWKLAAVLSGSAPEALLDTYEPERISFARRLVATTDRVFTAATSGGRLARILRVGLFPRVFPALTKLAAVRRFMFRTVSQTAMHYRASTLSEGRAGRLHGGDRLPWVVFDPDGGRGWTDNFAPLTSLDWQLHVYGNISPRTVDVCEARSLALHVFPWTMAANRAGLAKDAVYLIRPDGYVALADADPSSVALERYLTRLRLRPRAPTLRGGNR